MAITRLKLSDMSDEERSLAEMAREACGRAYAPYSRFSVGAAVRLSDGSVYCGANQENAAYGLCLCAERVAVLYAAADKPDCAPVALAIAARSGEDFCREPVTPCGACRQVLSEMEKRHGSAIRVLMCGEDECAAADSAADLMPLPFV